MGEVVNNVGFGVSREDPASLEQRSVLDAIERELARLEPDYAQNVLRLAEAYAWLAGAAHR